MKTRYLRIMEASLSAYTDVHIRRYLDEVRENGLTEHGFPRLASNIGITPLNDGKTLKLPIPALSEDRRKDLAKQAKAAVEDAKVALRNIRRDGNEAVKKAQKASEITEDESKKMTEDIQKLLDRYIAGMDKMLAEKEKELMTV